MAQFYIFAPRASRLAPVPCFLCHSITRQSLPLLLPLSEFVLCKSINEISFPKRGTIEDGKSEIDVFVHCVHYI